MCGFKVINQKGTFSRVIPNSLDESFDHPPIDHTYESTFGKINTSFKYL